MAVRKADGWVLGGVAPAGRPLHSGKYDYYFQPFGEKSFTRPCGACAFPNISEPLMGDVVNLITGRRRRGKKLPKPILCKECDEPIETARVQLLTGDHIMKPMRCFLCQSAWERRFEREMQGARERDTIQIIR